VVCSIGPDIEEVDTASIAEEVRKLNAKKDALVSDLDAIEDISQTMVDYSKSLAGDKVPPRQAERFFDNLLSRTRGISSTRADLKEEILQLSRQIDLLSPSETKKKGKTNGEVTVVIMAKKATEVELRLTYRTSSPMFIGILPLTVLPSTVVRHAAWSAAYELHATSEGGVPASSVSLHYRARITQSTGEDWTNVELTLSTADTDLSNQTIPVLSPTKIRPPPSLFYGAGPPQTQYPVQQQQIASKKAVRHNPAAAGGAFGSAPPPPGAPRRPDVERARAFAAPPAEEWLNVETDEDDLDEGQTTALGEPTTVVHESPLALTYHVEGASGVPSDGVPHQVSVAVLPFEAKILHVTVPKVRPVAYLQASVKNTSDYRLLPGTVHAFVDDSFVSKTAIVGDVAPGDVFSCTLGADPATRIRYTRTSKRADEHEGGGASRERSAFAEQWAATTYRSRTTVTNRHPFALRALVLRDGVPVSDDDKRVSVVLRRPEGLAELGQGEELKIAKDGTRAGDGDGESGKRTVRWSKVVDGKGGKKEGLFEWVVEIGAGEEVTIETEWDVKAPVSLKWVESA
jgi:hypothetical protein